MSEAVRGHSAKNELCVCVCEVVEFFFFFNAKNFFTVYICVSCRYIHRIYYLAIDKGGAIQVPYVNLYRTIVANVAVRREGSFYGRTGIGFGGEVVEGGA